MIKKGAKLVTSASDILEELNLNRNFEILKFRAEGKTPEENIILEILREGVLNIDKMIEKTNLPAAIVASTLAQLEIKNKVRNLGGNVFALKR